MKEKPVLPSFRFILRDQSCGLPDQDLGVFVAEDASKAQEKMEKHHRRLLNKLQTKTWAIHCEPIIERGLL